MNVLLLLMLFCCIPASAAEVDPLLQGLLNLQTTLAPELKTVFALTALSFIPVFFIAATSFTRIIIVLSLLRHALGLQQTPPNIVLITLALFLTFFTMEPVFSEVKTAAILPYQAELIGMPQAIGEAVKPLKVFMISQTREQDFLAIAKMSANPLPANADDVTLTQLVPAFMLSELTTAFKMAFVIFIPFLLIDLVVASVLMALGMMMVPPITVSLPLKIMLFVLIDGWALITQSLVSSFQ
jgi:flagellar biosynthesis protein FliP